MKGISSSYLATYAPLRWILPSSGDLVDIALAFIIPIILWIVFYFYWASKEKSFSEIKFFIIPLIISVLYFTRVLVFIPFLNRPHPDTYNIFFIFFIVFLFLKIKFDKLSPTFRKILIIALILIPLLGVLVSAMHTPFFVEHTQGVQDTFYLFNYVDGPFLMINNPGEVNGGAAYSYAALYHDLHTPSGWGGVDIPEEHMNKVRRVSNEFDERDCEGFSEASGNLNVTNIIGFGESCEILQECGLKEVRSRNTVCLFKF
jgi:hypothetical protein